MSEIIKFGAKSTNGIATAVQCNPNGNLITEKNWGNNIETLYNDTPTAKVNVQKKLVGVGICSLRVYNLTNQQIQISLCNDVPPATQLTDFGWEEGLLQASDGFSTKLAGNNYQKSFICTPEIVTITERLTINVESGTLTIPNFNAQDEYTGRYNTITGGGSREFSSGTKVKFTFNPGDGDRTIGVEHQLAKIFLSNNVIDMYGVTDGQYIVNIPVDTQGRVYTITPNDWPVLNYLNSLSININPAATITNSGKVRIDLVTKK